MKASGLHLKPQNPMIRPELPEIFPTGVKLRDPEDFATARKNIYDGVLEETRKTFPHSFGGVRMEAQDIDYEDPEDFDLHQQKDALLNKKYLSRRIRGTVKLFDDKTNTLLDEKRMTLMRVPHLTERGTSIHGGSEYTTMNQLRLLPGPYARRKANGELESHMSVLRGTGSGFRVRFEPKSMLYKMDIGQSQLRLYSLLHDIGVPDQEMETAWGPEIFQANKDAYDPRVLDKAHQRLVKKPDPNAPREQKVTAIKAAFEAMQFNRRVAQKNLPNMFDREKAAAWRTMLPPPPPAEVCTVSFDMPKQAARLIPIGPAVETLYSAIQIPETGSYKDPWVKSATSTAYGPVQLTALLAGDYVRRFPGIFNPGEQQYLKKYAGARGVHPEGTDREMYVKVAQKIMGHMLRVRANHDTDRFIELWRGVPESRDPNYYSTVRDYLGTQKTASAYDWMESAFIKLAASGAIVFLAAAGGKYLLERNPPDDEIAPNKLRPPGGGTETADADSEATMLRELNEEFGLEPDEIKDRLRYLGKDPRPQFAGTAVYELRRHGLKPGRYQASNDPDEVVDLEIAALDDPDYNGPPASMLA